MRSSRVSLLAIAALFAGCPGSHDPVTGDGAPPIDASKPSPPDARTDGSMPDANIPDADVTDYPFSDLDVGCPRIFDQDIVPEYHLTISSSSWSALQDDFLHPQLMPDGEIVAPPYHPVDLHIIEGNSEHDPQNVAIRISGNTSWLQALMFDADPKMQFTIAFNQIDSGGRFENQRKVKLDMPRNDWTYLQQRVASAWLRGRAGVPATCANNAKVYINGAYYGLYTNLEHQDKSFLKRVYGAADDDGDLWKGGRVITTNEGTYTWTHIDQFWSVTGLSGLDALTELDTSMLEWVSEAMIGDSDGYNNGRANFYLYDNPESSRFVWLENDLDTVLDPTFLAATASPVFPPVPSYAPRWEPDWYQYLITMKDPAGVARYVHALSLQLPKMDATEVDTWIAAWAAQIDDAAQTDPHRPFSAANHTTAITAMRSYVPARTQYLQRWLDCTSVGGVDADGDGYDLCHDCDESNPNTHPGAVEVCDHVDNDCDGRVDDLADPNQSCPPSLTGTETRRGEVLSKVLLQAKLR